MKAILLADEINQFHWSILKSVTLIISLLPLNQFIWDVWLGAEGSSQIVIGFFALSFALTSFILSFWSALKMSVASTTAVTNSVERMVISLYRQVPMLCLTGMLSYLVMSV